MPTEPTEEEVHRLQERYVALMHAMETGVATKMSFDPSDTSPKRTRVGINSALLQTSALAKLLMDNRIITELEWWTVLVEFAENEVRMYQEVLSSFSGEQVYLR